MADKPTILVVQDDDTNRLTLRDFLVQRGFLKPNFDIPYPVFAKPFDYGELSERINDLLKDLPKS